MFHDFMVWVAQWLLTVAFEIFRVANEDALDDITGTVLP
jgi:hypothetical protein